MSHTATTGTFELNKEVKGKGIMNKDEQIRQQVSELTDGELAPPLLQPLLAALRKPEIKADWDLYHRIGDTLRCEQMASQLSPTFSRKLEQRLAAEPVLLTPQRTRPAASLRGWGVALAALAAAATGFMLSPSLFHPNGDARSPAVVAAKSQDNAAAETMLADAGGATAHSKETADYILLHQSANPSLYGVPALAQHAALSSHSEK